mgnify:CR=1 FL=1
MGTSPRTITIDATDGERIHVYDLGPQDAPRTLVIVHGYGEHGGRYLQRAERFVENGWRVLIPDMRGHGHSTGARGHVRRFAQYVADLDRVLLEARTDREHTALLGHSNGGLIVLTRLLQEPARFAACVVTSPLLGLAVEAPRWKIAAGRLMSQVLPRVSLPTEIRPEHLSHDPAVVAAYASDPLGHKVVNSRWFTEAMQAVDDAFANAGRVRVPLLVIQSGDDRIASPEASRQWAGAAPSEFVEFEEVPGAFHELLFETDGDEHMLRVRAFLEQRCPA